MITLGGLRIFALCAASLAVAVPAVVEAQEEARMEFKGIKLGSSLAELKALARVKCESDKTGSFDQVCYYINARDVTYAGRPARIIQFGFFADRLDSVTVDLAGTEYDDLRREMNSKFGEFTPGPGLSGLVSYMMNGDRAHLFYSPNSNSTVVIYEAAAGVEERLSRRAKTRAKTRGDM